MRWIDIPCGRLDSKSAQRLVEILAERQDIGALLHHDADLQRRLALRADEIGRGVFVAVFDIGDVAEAKRRAIGEYRRLAHCRDAFQRAGHAHRDALARSLEFAGGIDGVLLGERIEQRLHRHAERRQFGVAEFDEDALRLVAVEVDLRDVGNALQPPAERFGDFLQLRI